MSHVYLHLHLEQKCVSTSYFNLLWGSPHVLPIQNYLIFHCIAVNMHIPLFFSQSIIMSMSPQKQSLKEAGCLWWACNLLRWWSQEKSLREWGKVDNPSKTHLGQSPQKGVAVQAHRELWFKWDLSPAPSWFQVIHSQALGTLCGCSLSSSQSPKSGYDRETGTKAYLKCTKWQNE